jgi:beta-galactosidase
VTFPNCEPETLQARLWFDILRTTTAQPIGIYQAGYFSGTPAITLNRFGEGQAVYVATLGDDTLHDTVVDWALKVLDLHPALQTPAGVEVTARWQGDQQLLFLLNHTGVTQEVPIAQAHLDLLSGITVNDIVKIPPYGVSILKGEG